MQYTDDLLKLWNWMVIRGYISSAMGGVNSLNIQREIYCLFNQMKVLKENVLSYSGFTVYSNVFYKFMFKLCFKLERIQFKFFLCKTPIRRK